MGKYLIELYESGEAKSVVQEAEAELESLRAQLKEAQAEIDRLKERQEFAPDQWWVKELSGIDSTLRNLTHDEYRSVRIAVTAINVLMFDNAASQARISELEMKLAASQANEVQLREALGGVCRWFQAVSNDNLLLDWQREARKALSLPSDTTALEAMIQKAGEVMRERCMAELKRLDYWYSANAISALPGATLQNL